MTQRLLLTLLASGLLAGGVIPAQAQDIASGAERLRIRAGEIFEILAVESRTDAEIAWVLSQEQTFLQAGRERSFRFRLAQTGKYLLMGEIAIPDRKFRRIFIIDVLPRDGEGRDDLPSLPAAGRIESDPSRGDDRIALHPSSQLLKLIPPADSASFLLDTDIAEDRNGDNEPANDVDNAKSVARTDGSPLFLWFPDPAQTERTIGVWLTFRDGRSTSEAIQIVRGDAAESLSTPTDIHVTPQTGGTVRFATELGRQMQAGTPLLFAWDFGDGRRSLLTEPIHRYTANGSYTVIVTARNLSDGRILFRGQTGIRVEGIGEPLAASSSSPSGAEATTEPGTAGLSLLPSLSRIVIWLLWILGLIAVGAGAQWGIRLLRNMREETSQDLEEAERKISRQKEEVEKGVGATPPPLEIRPSPPPRAESEPGSSQPPTPPPELEPEQEEPAIEQSEAPTWLRKGLDRPIGIEGEKKDEEALPPWLQEKPETEEPEDTENETPSPDDTQLPPPPPSPPPPPPILSSQPPPPPPASDAAASDEQAQREQERKRLKRLRYRQNKKRRLQEQRVAATSAAQGKESQAAAPLGAPPAPEAMLGETLPSQSPALPLAPVAPPLPATQLQTVELAEEERSVANEGEKQPDDDVAFFIRAEGVDDQNGKGPSDTSGASA